MFGSIVWPSIVFSKDGRVIHPDELLNPFEDLIVAATIGGAPVEFYRDGSVRVDSPTRHEAIERLNCFVLCLRLLRYSKRFLPRFRQHELCQIKNNKLWQESPMPDNQILEEAGAGNVTIVDHGPRYLIEDLSYTSFRSVFIAHPELRKELAPFTDVRASELEVALELADRLFNSSMKTQMLTLIEAWTLRSEADTNTSFILSWICIESMLYSQTMTTYGADAIYVTDREGRITTSRSGKKIEKPISTIIGDLRIGLQNGTLNFSADEPRIEEYYLDKVDGIRIIRNDIVHGNRRATPQELEECYGALHTALWRLMRMAGIQDYNQYRDRMEQARSVSNP